MENKDKGFKVMAVVALLIAVVGLSIAYAGYTATLTVEGTATVKSAWEIVWTTLDNGTATGYADVDDKTLAIDETDQAISGDIGNLRAPGDTIKYTWKAENKGEIDATLTGVTLGTLSCKPKQGGKATQTQADAVCAKLSVDFTYDGAALTASTKGDLLKEAKKDVTMTIKYAEGDAVEIDDDITVTLGKTSFTYEQKATS